MELIQNIKKYKWVLLIIALLVMACLVFLYVDGRVKVSDAVVVESDNSLIKPSNIPNDNCEIFVDVSGAVQRPNVYCFQKGSMIIDAIKKAGGFKEGKYALEFVRSTLNLSRELVGNEKIYIPYSNEVSCSKLVVKLVAEESGGSPNSEVESNCVSLNESTKEQLMSLEGVGESLASKIMDKRPFKNTDDLNLVSGVGDQMFEKLRDKVCL